MHRFVHPFPKGWVLRKGSDSEPPRLRIALFFGPGPVSRGLKNFYGMLNVLPPVVPVKRIPLPIVARKCHRYRVEKFGCELRAAGYEPNLNFSVPPIPTSR